MEDSKQSKSGLVLKKRIHLSKKGANPLVQWKLLAETIKVMIADVENFNKSTISKRATEALMKS